MFVPSNPVTGGAQFGLTSPTYTLTPDTAPSALGRQYAVTALGGTQPGVLVSTVSSPFTSTMYRPAQLAVLPKPDANGVLRSVPVNKWALITRKGVIPLAGQQSQTAIIRTTIEMPAGADTADPLNLQAALSLHFGILFQESLGIGNTVQSGIL